MRIENSNRVKKRCSVFIILCIFLFLSCSNSNLTTGIIRKAFDKGGYKMNSALEKHIPQHVSAIPNEQYDLTDPDAYLDIYLPEQAEQSVAKYPLIVWIHGGAWVAGSKEQVANYCKILSGEGYVVAAVNYSLAPRNTYPKPVHQINSALQYLMIHSERLSIDTTCIVLAGDSGGAQLAAQLGTLTTVPAYASQLAILPTLQPSQLAGLILYCGAYDLDKVKLTGKFSGFVKNVLCAYSGDKNFMENEMFATLSVYQYVNEDFPPSFISAGNGDPLAEHSYALAQKLAALGVQVDTLFFEKEYTPALPHEYQFNLDTDEGQLALKRSLQFLNNVKSNRK